MNRFVESIEPRLCLAATLSGGVLTVTGSEARDVVEPNLRDNGQLKVEIGTSEQRFSYAAVSQIVVRALGGNDTVEFNDRNPITKPVTIFAGTGNDTVEGTVGRDTIYGGGGNDYLDGREGNDRIYGESGNDKLEGKGGNDLLEGGSGNDWLQGHAGNDTLIGASGHDDLEGGTGTDRISGGSGNDDFLSGSTSAEILDRTAEDNGNNVLVTA
jgi:Ca2+-binding RTX toxin-like protein